MINYFDCPEKVISTIAQIIHELVKISVQYANMISFSETYPCYIMICWSSYLSLLEFILSAFSLVYE